MSADNTGRAPLAMRRSGLPGALDVLAYDSLPEPVRALMRDAPINMSAPGLADELRRSANDGEPLDEFTERKRRAWRRLTKDSTRLAYGADHPQA